MRRALLLATACVALAAAEPARAGDDLAVRSARLDVDRGTVSLRLTCRASRAACRGSLRLETDGVAPLTHTRRVRLRPGRERAVRLRLRRDGLERLGIDNDEHLVWVYLGSGDRPLEGSAVVEIRVTCRSGSTTAQTPLVRVLLVAGIGTWACDRPRGRLTFLGADDHGLTADEIAGVAVAGTFVAVHRRSAWKCGGSTVELFDVRARRRVRFRAARAKTHSDANACTGTAPVVALVLRPSGALAWTEAPGDDGVAFARALDDAGERTLDQGPDLDPASLAPEGSTLVRWTRGGRVALAPLR